MNKKRKHCIEARSLLCAASLLVAAGAQADTVVVVGTKSPASNMSKEQVADVFMGRATNFTPLDLPESSPVRDEFYSKVTGKSAAQAKSYWAKLSFTGKGTPPKEVPNSAEVKKEVAENPSLMGYIEKSAVDGSVKVLFTAP
ncbi:uncharacterized protein NMK_0873 [Novimethylophilus kurashikiensis]|uniref:Phosphate ABC transporter substrate-binding protein n=1 Tax=Novimethylophilus kurashikiensis TaxID=1825523 RepID=A0A2R5F4K1_9PROT|nr:hypothetical protein [Novimethylophilus kurashikiensis]GBG13327.1 uncharacterized protein NMK_0873 [Novimethylophilus kurashikiensis]